MTLEDTAEIQEDAKSGSVGTLEMDGRASAAQSLGTNAKARNPMLINSTEADDYMSMPLK